MPAAEPKVLYSPRTDATPESELNALAVIYRFILDCHAKKEGRPTTSGPDDAEGSRNERTATEIIPKPS